MYWMEGCHGENLGEQTLNLDSQLKWMAPQPMFQIMLQHIFEHNILLMVSMWSHKSMTVWGCIIINMLYIHKFSYRVNKLSWEVDNRHSHYNISPFKNVSSLFFHHKLPRQKLQKCLFLRAAQLIIMLQSVGLLQVERGNPKGGYTWTFCCSM